MKFFLDSALVDEIEYALRQGIYSSSVEKWRPYEQYLQPVKDVLGL